MNNFSDKEYQILKDDTVELRSCITRYIGYIISVTGISGFFKYFFSSSNNLIGILILLTFSIVVVTFLFEIIWYKLKSHNRYVGYIQLLMQEVDAIPTKISKKSKLLDVSNTITEEVLSSKDLSEGKHIQYYQQLLNRKYPKGIDDLYSWEFVMSRLHANHFIERDQLDNERAILNSVSKSRFVFSVPAHLQSLIEIGNHDKKFFSKIIFSLYLKENDLPFLRNIFRYLKFLISSKTKVLLNKIDIDKSYAVNGWRYPKKVTQIAFAAVILNFVFLIYYLFAAKFSETINFNNGYEKVAAIILLIIALLIVIFFWLLKYLRGLKDLVYGKYSIDFYCWMFFVYRTQLLNNKGVVPVIFSRAFVRYFKTNLYHKVYSQNEIVLKRTLKSLVSEKELNIYENKLKKLKSFNPKERVIHNIIVESFKDYREKSIELGGESNNIEIPEKIFLKNKEKYFHLNLYEKNEHKLKAALRGKTNLEILDDYHRKLIEGINLTEEEIQIREILHKSFKEDNRSKKSEKYMVVSKTCIRRSVDILYKVD